MAVVTTSIELTNKCNLNCNHCLRELNVFSRHLPLKTISIIVKQSKSYRIRDIRLTGGEPTLHPYFKDILGIFAANRYRIKLLTNGKNFCHIYKNITKFKNNIADIRFSLDGAEPLTHDKNRGRGSFKQVVDAIKICKKERLPFSLIMVITRLNFNELEKIVKFAILADSNNLFFAQLQPGSKVSQNKLMLSIKDCLFAERTVRRLKNRFRHKINIGLCVNSYMFNPLFLCRVPLNSFNIDYKGNIVYCRQLSSLNLRLNGKEIIGNLKDIDLREAREKVIYLYKEVSKQKIKDVFNNRFNKSDHFPCRYCLRYFKISDEKKTERFPLATSFPVI